MKTNQTFSILFWISKNRTRNGKAPIYARITVDGRRAEISIQRTASVDRWDPNSGHVNGRDEEARTLNSYIDKVKVSIENHYNILLSKSETLTKGETITPEMVKNSYLGICEKGKTLIEVFKYHNEQMKNMIGIDFSDGTHKRYEVTLRKIEAFIKAQCSKSDIPLNELTYKFIADFEFHLKTIDKLDHNTAMKYIKNVKKIVNVAVKNQWLDKNPFLTFKCTTKEVVKEFLIQAEIETLREKKFPAKRLEEVRDIFIFSCYTGYSFSDVQKFSPKHISLGIDGQKWIITQRIKTESTSNVPLLPIAEELIEKYKAHPECVSKDRLFPVKSNQKVNTYLKEIADLCGITKPLTFHIARHTFATTITLSNGVPIESVSSMLGHRSIRTTQIYAKVVQKKVSEDMKLLKEKLKVVPIAELGIKAGS